MRWFHSVVRRAIALLVLALLVGLLVMPLPASAQSGGFGQQFVQNLLTKVQSQFSRRRGIGSPSGRRYGGGGRGAFCQNEVEGTLTAIVPSQKEPFDGTEGNRETATDIEYSWGLTTESQPTLWVHVPYRADQVGGAELMLLDASRYPVSGYPEPIPLSNAPGIIPVQLPHALRTNGSYNWYFSLVCDQEKPSRNPGVKGWIERIDPPQALLDELETSNQPKYITYLNHNIWFDAVTDLLKESQNNPNDSELRRSLATLLNSYRLNESQLLRR